MDFHDSPFGHGQPGDLIAFFDTSVGVFDGETVAGPGQSALLRPGRCLGVFNRGYQARIVYNLPFVVDAQAAPVLAGAAGIGRQVPFPEHERKLGFLNFSRRQGGFRQGGNIQGGAVRTVGSAVSYREGISVEEKLTGLRVVAIGLDGTDIAGAAGRHQVRGGFGKCLVNRLHGMHQRPTV